jgi:predicted thioesterase
VEAGTSATVALTVTEADTALALRSGDVPVLGTPRVVALVEQAAVAAVRDQLAPEQTSVGAVVELEHRRPTRVGATIEAQVVLAAVDGTRLEFRFTVTEGGREVARGRHRRVIVDRTGFATGSGTSSASGIR